MPHPPYSSFSIERICAPLCQQVRYCTLSILDSTLSKSRTTCQFRTDSEHQLTFLSKIKQKILKPLRFQDFSWSEWRDLNSLNPFYTVHGHPGMYCFQWFQRFFRTSLYHVKPTEITPLREKIRETFYSHADARFLKHIQKAKLKRQNDR